MSQANDTPKPTAFSVFRNRNFGLMWTGDLVSQFGNGITSVAASILVFRETSSALSVGLMLIATALPGFLFGLIAGVFVDRWDRKRIMLICEFLRAILVFLIPALLPYGIWWMYILVMLSATVTQFYGPAHVVAEEDTTLLRVPATALREMSGKPELNRFFLSKMTECMVRMDLLDIPQMMERDQGLLRELRSPEPQLEATAA